MLVVLLLLLVDSLLVIHFNWGTLILWRFWGFCRKLIQFCTCLELKFCVSTPQKSANVFKISGLLPTRFSINNCFSGSKKRRHCNCIWCWPRECLWFGKNRKQACWAVYDVHQQLTKPWQAILALDLSNVSRYADTWKRLSSLTNQHYFAVQLNSTVSYNIS